jgi:uncharacterized protein
MAKEKNKIDRAMVIRRSFNVPDFRAAPQIENSGPAKLEGHAAVFDSMTNIGGWYNEVIARGAFDGCDFDDVLFFINHDMQKVPLARSRRNNSNSTMQLSIDNIGLYISAQLDLENNSEARQVYSSVSRGDISGMSFCFRVADDTWDGLDTDMPTRTIVSIATVYEVSAVNSPAYELTDISARDKSALENARAALENARRSKQELENSSALNIYKMRNKILGGI